MTSPNDAYGDVVITLNVSGQARGSSPEETKGASDTSGQAPRAVPPAPDTAVSAEVEAAEKIVGIYFEQEVTDDERMEAVRGGYAMRRSRLQSTRCYHVAHTEQRINYLCGCYRPILGITGFSMLRRGQRKDARFADGYRYRLRRL